MTVTAQRSRRVPVATLIAAGPGAAGRAQLIYRTHVDREHSTHRRDIQFCACALIGAAARPGIASRYLPTIESLGRDHPRPALAGDSR